ncbi:MAG: FAD binding domain-containing protein [Ilumatobacteraceae bacterium]
MVSAPFDYLAATTFAEAIEALEQFGDGAVILAGGQSLVPMLNLRLVQPQIVIDINGVPAEAPAVDDGRLTLSALTRHAAVLSDPLVAAASPMLVDAVRHVGNVRVRNRGTVGGSLAHADPTSEIGAAALCLDGEVVVTGATGSRTVPVDELFVSYLTTSIAPGELLTALHLPTLNGNSGVSFVEMVRRTSDFAIVAVAALVELEADATTIKRARVALSGVADRPRLADASLTDELVGQELPYGQLRSLGAEIASRFEPADDVHASAAYRRRLIEVLTARALHQAMDRARS